VGMGVSVLFALHAQVHDDSGHPWLARTLDWPMPMLRRMTIQVRFLRDRRVLYHATTFVGYTGVLTAMRPGGFAVAVNYRLPIYSEDPRRLTALAATKSTGTHCAHHHHSESPSLLPPASGHAIVILLTILGEVVAVESVQERRGAVVPVVVVRLEIPDWNCHWMGPWRLWSPAHLLPLARANVLRLRCLQLQQQQRQRE
jgi:hypothetical protein